MKTWLTLCATAVFGATGCSSFELGACRSPVQVVSRESRLVDGADVALTQDASMLTVKASHRCRVFERAERTAGARAERFHPGAGLDLVRAERERKANNLGPLDVGSLRGIDPNADNHGMASQLVHSAGSPWVLAAVAGGIVERLLVARSRVDAKIDDRGELSSTERRSENTPCRDNPFDGEVALQLGDGGPTVALGRTGDDGELRVDLSAVLEPEASLVEAGPVEGTLLLDGAVVGAVDLRYVVGALALRTLRSDLRAPAATVDTPSGKGLSVARSR